MFKLEIRRNQVERHIRAVVDFQWLLYAFLSKDTWEVQPGIARYQRALYLWRYRLNFNFRVGVYELRQEVLVDEAWLKLPEGLTSYYRQTGIYAFSKEWFAVFLANHPHNRQPRILYEWITDCMDEAKADAAAIQCRNG